MVYLNHQRFLQPNDPLQKAQRDFPSRLQPPNPLVVKDMSYLSTAVLRYESAKTAVKRKEIVQETGCKGHCAFQTLPHYDRYLNTPVEPMHLIKNIVEHMVRLISGGEDSEKVRAEEKQRGGFRSSWMKEGKSTLPAAPFRLTRAEMKVANARALSIKVPTGFDWKPKAVFLQGIAMKSHSWKQLVATFILKFCLRGLLGKRQRQMLFFVLDVLAQLCAESVRATELNTLEQDVHRALALLERDFPVSLHVVVFHLLHHLPFYLQRFGPIYGYWMYPFERFNSWVIRRVNNRRYPEATVVETYRLYEWAHFIQVTGHLPQEALVHPDSVEGIDCKPIQTTTQLAPDEADHLHMYYQGAIPEYKALCSRYQEERRKARARHRLKQFPAMSSWMPVTGPVLTPLQLEMRANNLKDIIRFEQLTYKNSHGRHVRVCSRHADTENTSSSYTFIKLPDNSLVFGQVQFFFEHTFAQNRNTFAFVQWFNSPKKDAESGLWYVSLHHNKSVNPIVPLNKLSTPLVTAVDTDVPDRLWIITFV